MRKSWNLKTLISKNLNLACPFLSVIIYSCLCDNFLPLDILSNKSTRKLGQFKPERDWRISLTVKSKPTRSRLKIYIVCLLYFYSSMPWKRILAYFLLTGSLELTSVHHKWNAQDVFTEARAKCPWWVIPFAVHTHRGCQDWLAYWQYSCLMIDSSSCLLPLLVFVSSIIGGSICILVDIIGP